MEIIYDPILARLRSGDGSRGDVSELTERVDALEAAVTALEQGSAEDVHVENFRFIYADSPDDDKLRLAENFLQDKFTHQGVYHIILYNAGGNSQNAGVLYVSPGQNRLHQVLIYTLDARVYVYSRRILWTEWAKLETGEYTGFEWIKTQIAGQNTAWESAPVVNPDYGDDPGDDPGEPEVIVPTYMNVDDDTLVIHIQSAAQQIDFPVATDGVAVTATASPANIITGITYGSTMWENPLDDGMDLHIFVAAYDPSVDYAEDGYIQVTPYASDGTLYPELAQTVTVRFELDQINE